MTLLFTCHFGSCHLPVFVPACADRHRLVQLELCLQWRRAPRALGGASPPHSRLPVPRRPAQAGSLPPGIPLPLNWHTGCPRPWRRHHGQRRPDTHRKHGNCAKIHPRSRCRNYMIYPQKPTLAAFCAVCQHTQAKAFCMALYARQEVYGQGRAGTYVRPDNVAETG